MQREEQWCIRLRWSDLRSSRRNIWIVNMSSLTQSAFWFLWKNTSNFYKYIFSITKQDKQQLGEYWNKELRGWYHSLKKQGRNRLSAPHLNSSRPMYDFDTSLLVEWVSGIAPLRFFVPKSQINVFFLDSYMNIRLSIVENFAHCFELCLNRSPMV